LIKPIYILGIDAQVQNRVGDQDYGLYFALFNFCFLFSIILDMGIQNYNSKNISAHRESVSKIFSNVLATKLILILIFTIFVVLLGSFIYPDKAFVRLILGLSVIMSLQSFYIYLRSHFSAIGKFKIETYLSALDKLLMIFILGYIIYISDTINIQNFILGQIGAYLLAILLAFILLSRFFKIKLAFSLSKSKHLLKQSAPFALVVLLMTLYTRMDGVMLERLLNDNASAAGKYATAFRLMDAANVIGYLFAVLLLPMFANMLSKKEDINPLIKNATGLLFSITSIISVASWCYADEIMHLIYIDIDAQNIESFRLLMMGFWAMSMSYIFGSLITASGQLKTFNLIFIIGIAMNWILNLWLIPGEFAIGAAKATVVTQFFVFLAQVFLAFAKFKISFGMRFWLSAIGLLGIYFAISFLLYHYLPIYWGLKLMAFIILTTFVSFLAGFFRLSLR